MRKTDETLRRPERPMTHLVAVSLVVAVVLALAALGVLDDVIRIIGN